MTFQLNFENPLQVSKLDTDQIQVLFLNQSCFRAAEENIYIRKNYTTLYNMPLLMMQNGFTESFAEMTTSVKEFMNTMGASNIILNLFLGTTLQYIWGMINCLQLIVNIPLMGIQMPANVVFFYSILINFVTFNIIPTDEMFNKTFDFYSTDYYNTKFNELGYGSMNIVENLGSNMIYIWIIAGLYILQFGFKFIKGCHRQLNRFYHYTAKSMYYSVLIRYAIENYLNFSICSLLNIYKLYFRTWSDYIASILTFVFVANLLLLPFAIVVFLYVNFKKLAQETFKRKYGSLYENIDTNSKSKILFNFVFLIRRTIFIFTIFFFSTSPVF